MTSAFYNMAEEREEGGLLLDFTELFPPWIKQPQSALAAGLSTQAQFELGRQQAAVYKRLKRIFR